MTDNVLSDFHERNQFDGCPGWLRGGSVRFPFER